MSSHELNPQLTRRGFLRWAAVGAGVLAISPLARYALEFFRISRPVDALISDPMMPTLGEPLDLSTDARITPVVNELTETNKGIISYRELLHIISEQHIVMYGEAPFNDGDKVALCEIINAAQTSHPDRKIVLALGRFKPEDNKALEDFISNRQLSESEALAALQKNSTYGKEWDQQPLNDTAPGKQYGKTLLLCRRLGIRLVATGVDRGLSTQGNEQTPKQAIELQSRAAQIMFDLAVQNPSALIIGQMGRPAIIRDQKEQSVTQQLEKLLAQNRPPFAESIKVLAVQTADPSSGDSTFLTQKMNGVLGETLEHHQNILNNSAFVVVQPEYSSARLDQSNKPVRSLPGADFELVRYFGNGWNLVGLIEQLNRKICLIRNGLQITNLDLNTSLLT